MNFLQLCQQVREEAGIGGGGPASVKNQTGMLKRIVGWVQQEYLKLQQLNNWAFLWRRITPTLQAGKATYTAVELGVPELGQILARKLYLASTGERIAYMPMDRMDVLTPASGKPRFFTRQPDGAVTFYPTPDQAYALKGEHLRAPHALADNTDEPVIPEEHLQWVVVWAALKRYALHSEDPAAMGNAKDGYAEVWAQLCDKHLPDMVGTPLTLVEQQASEPLFV